MVEMRHKILLVEDEGLLAANLTEELDQLGYSAAAVNSGEKALSKIAEDRPDLVLMDIKLKGQLDGIETSMRIKDHFKIPVIYLSAHADQATLDRACPTEPYGYLVKPVDERELAATVRTALSRSQAEQQLRRLEEERWRTEGELREAQKLEMLRAVAAGVAHDFNNLLAVIMGHAGLLEQTLPEDSPERESLHKIRNATQRGAELCKQMMVYAGNGLRLNSRFSIGAIAQEITDQVRESLPPGAELETNLASDLPLVCGDPGQIRQLIMNLVLNASEAISGQAGHIRVTTGTRHLTREALSAAAVTDSACQPGEFVFLEVSDTGCGMTQETIRRIFDPFFTTKFLGRGLGLAVVSGIVRAHKGALMVQSQPGQGTTFCMLLPVDVQRSEAPI
jgi:two-component system, cell cycle sensor histidine kinase and response regulator CckA